MLEVKNIHKVYHNGKKSLEVLRGVNLHIEREKFIAIVGPSGAGKSTLLHIMGGLDTPTRGEVIFHGEDLYKMSDNALSKARNIKIGFVFQFYHLLPEFTILENVLIPAWINRVSGLTRKELEKKASGLLREAGLGERAGHYPQQLSGGEKQRAAIVRALINNPELLLCDEPTGNLDSQTGEEIMSLLKKINRENKATVAVVTHNLELARSSDRIYHLKDGLLVG